MSLFLLTFFLLYGSVHFYAFLKARSAYGFGTVPGVTIVLLMSLMVAAPVLVRLAEKRGMEETGKVLAFAGYTWMGVLFLFFSASIALDLYHGVLWSAGKASGKDLAVAALSAKARFVIPVVWGVLISIYGVFEARDITVERVTIETPKLPVTVGKIRIVQISDVHLGLMVRERRVATIVARIRESAPDILVSTGDFVDGQLDGLTSVAELFTQLRPRFGKFAVTGNHEFYAGLRPSLMLTESAGFQVLRGESATVGDVVTIAGVDDPAARRTGAASITDEHSLFSRLSRDKFILLLKHRPEMSNQSFGMFDLQLSGHVHKGQIFPFNCLTHLFYPVRMGLSLWQGKSYLYVSRGTGTWGPPIRFLAPPEVTVIDLVPQKAR